MHRGLPTRVLVSSIALFFALTFASVAQAGECDPVMPLADVTTGMTGTGWTVAKGRTKVPFDVEILGVAKGGIGPGRDLIIVEVSSPELDAAGGIWAGMSGSPVYVSGDLVGAVSYGFSFGPSLIGGVTPAEDMLNLIGLPSFAPTAVRAPRSVRLPTALARTVAGRTGASIQQASTLRQISVPLSISGLTTRSMQLLATSFKTHQLDGLVPYSGGSAARGAAVSPVTVEPGDNFAAAVSYGDVTAAAIGTATYSCDGQALAFGHPFLFGGAYPTGANAADAFAIVPDPVYGPFKFAQIAEPLGVVDQDRLAGLRASLGGEPDAIPIQTKVNVPELGIEREGLTEVVVNDWAGYLTFAGLLAGIDSAFDSSGDWVDYGGKGTASAWWTFEGTRADGSPWKIDRGNRWVSKYAIAPTVAINPGFQLDSLIYNPSEQIKVTSARVTVTIQKAVKLYTIKEVLVGDGNGRYHARGRISVHRGHKLPIRVVLRQFEGGTKNLDYVFRIPKNAPSGWLLFYGTSPFYQDQCYGGFCWVDDGDYYEFPSDFEGQLAGYQRRTRNDVLTGELSLGRRIKGSRTTRLDGVVVGFAGLRLLPGGASGGSIQFYRGR